MTHLHHLWLLPAVLVGMTPVFWAMARFGFRGND
jgi:hypothetical protein